MFISAKKDCPHFKDQIFFDYNDLQFFPLSKVFDEDEEEDRYMKLANLLLVKKDNIILEERQLGNASEEEQFQFEKEFKKSNQEYNSEEISPTKIPYLCLTCCEIAYTKDDFIKHYEDKNHSISINLTDLSIWCNNCTNPICINKKGTPIKPVDTEIEKIKNHIQYLREKKYLVPFFKYYSKEQIFEIKYNKLINSFLENKFQNIIFMVGAGISTNAGIPDFRSKTGLFKQLQEKYEMKSPEEFFYKKTFIQRPNLFYEFCKIFDLSTVKPTLTHKFMGYMINKGLIKYVFTQNIDGLELKAKIPKEKIIFAHGTFTEGHCPQCKIPVDINKINEGIQKGEIVYCHSCHGPCKPNVVFYGESLSHDFYQKVNLCRDCDLVIILGTSLQVYPFAAIPKVLKNKSWKLVINKDKVGKYKYDFLSSNSIFLSGITDQIILKLLRDIKLIDEFKRYVKEEFGDENIEQTEEMPMLKIQNNLSEENKDNCLKIKEKTNNISERKIDEKLN